ncbi:MAG TPA: hypothetical protein DET40_04025 [Lentisphaeria bacterium]|nr:MAG: hypothetical protein A2X45_01915 [Lentisphaerae bacterium GWF2_50_93]HCE42694.1 hypothetical protein [Lentisphaeria bacterium]
MNKIFSFLTTYAIFAVSISLLADNPAVGTTEIAKWKDNSKACFMIMFDDSWPSHYQVAVPELVKRKMTATFYINPGKGEYKAKKADWEGEKAVWKSGMAYGNHTMSHDGMQNLKDAEWEIQECNKIILDLIPGKNPRLISWGRPGVKDWNISKEETKAILERNYLIDRPTFDNHGVVYHLKTADQMFALADKAIKDGGMEYIIAHGVERGPDMNWGYQDFWAWKQDQFKAVLDGLAERRDRGDLWITDHISYHKYEKERQQGKVETIAADNSKIRLKLTSQANPELYDSPLTLRTAVPKAWTKCKIQQKDKTTTVDVKDGIAQFDSLPGSDEIVLTAG